MSAPSYLSPASGDGSDAGRLPRRRLEAAEARDAILASAEGLLVSSGPEALRLTEIAAKAGVSHPNVLYHFGSVAELQRQLAQRGAGRLANEIARVFAGDEGLSMPIDRAVAACFAVFDEGGYARLLAWLALSANQPTWEAVGSNLGALRAAIVAHPSLGGDANEERRRRVVPVIELVIVSAIGYGLMGTVVEGFFESDPLRPNVSRLLSELLASVNEERTP
ncbi:MAG: TetR/AcrR family transcriptional regulator [Candidatus Eremiobacteraeota bacterium]|nr:TetR/AcrR family transcriptional regulator [Candidatus Eremiobacteraeota bacterium]